MSKVRPNITLENVPDFLSSSVTTNAEPIPEDGKIEVAVKCKTCGKWVLGEQGTTHTHQAAQGQEQDTEGETDGTPQEMIPTDCETPIPLYSAFTNVWWSFYTPALQYGMPLPEEALAESLNLSYGIVRQESRMGFVALTVPNWNELALLYCRIGYLPPFRVCMGLTTEAARFGKESVALLAAAQLTLKEKQEQLEIQALAVSHYIEKAKKTLNEQPGTSPNGDVGHHACGYCKGPVPAGRNFCSNTCRDNQVYFQLRGY